MNKFFKKIVPVMVTIAAFAGSASSAMAADFPDLPDDPIMRQALVVAAENGLFKGDDTGLIRPHGNITRAEMSAIITRCFGATKTADISRFADVPATEWYYEECSKAYAMGAFEGDDNGNYNPENNITFQETFAVVSRIFDIQDANAEVINTITDRDAIDDWAKGYVEKVYAGGYWNESILRPNDYITRGEFAVLMNNLVQVYVTEPGVYDELVDGNVVVRCGGVTFDMVTNTKKIIIGDGVDGDVVFKESDLNIIVGRGGVVTPSRSKVYKIRLMVKGAQAAISTTQAKDNNAEPYYGVRGTVFNLGSMQVQ